MQKSRKQQLQSQIITRAQELLKNERQKRQKRVNDELREPIYESNPEPRNSSPQAPNQMHPQDARSTGATGNTAGSSRACRRSEDRTHYSFLNIDGITASKLKPSSIKTFTNYGTIAITYQSEAASMILARKVINYGVISIYCESKDPIFAFANILENYGSLKMFFGSTSGSVELPKEMQNYGTISNFLYLPPNRLQINGNVRNFGKITAEYKGAKISIPAKYSNSN